MRVLMNRKLLGMIGLVVGFNCIIYVTSPAVLRARIGYQTTTYAGCQTPCRTFDNYTYECDHRNPSPPLDDCKTNACIVSHIWSATCATGNPPYDANKCNIGFDLTLPYVQQVLNSPSNPPITTCGNVQQPYGNVTVPGPCIFIPTTDAAGNVNGTCNNCAYQGRCIISYAGNCDGAQLLVGANRMGQPVCK